MTRNLGRYFHHATDRPRAIIYTPAADIESTARCLEHVREQSYHLVGVVAHDFAAAQRMLAEGKAAILVVDSRTDLPPERMPRFEVVAEFPPAVDPHRRRPTLINRRDAAT